MLKAFRLRSSLTHTAASAATSLRRLGPPVRMSHGVSTAAAPASAGELPASFQALASPLEDDHPIFSSAKLTEVRAGRELNVLVVPGPAGAASDVVFFLHGGMASMQQFEFQAEMLAKRCTVVAFDAFGETRPITNAEINCKN